MEESSIATALKLFSFFGEIETITNSCMLNTQNFQFRNLLLSVISKVSENVYEFANANDKWKEKTKEVLSNVSIGNISAEEIYGWIFEGKNIVALTLADQVAKESNVKPDEFSEIIKIFETISLNDVVRSYGFYAISKLYRKTNPMLSYDYGMRAFKNYNQLCELFDIKYVYDESSINDVITEKCPVCGCNESIPYMCVEQFVVADKAFSPYKQWMRCQECGNIYAYNFPIKHMVDINGHYTRSCSEDFITPRQNLSIYSEIFNKCSIFTKGKHYLEIGVGNGEMLAAALEFGYDADAVEICKEDCEKISAVLDIDIKWCDFMEYKSNKKYDIIVMGDVLEHVSGPAKALEKAADLLDDNGVLWLSTPNYNSGFTRLMRDHDPMWNQKNHYTYFSYEGLVSVIKKIGLTVKRYDISSRYNGSMELFITKTK